MHVILLCMAVGMILVINLLMLLGYQHYLAGDFPFQDEWGYVDRLRHLPETGFLHYLFDRYQTYFIPTFLLIWYLFYVFVHLDFMVIRYTGGVVTVLVALLLCVMLYRRTTRLTPSGVICILIAPFIICCFSHWASYNQAIESVIEPLLFGLVLLATWIAERAQSSTTRAAAWDGLCVAVSLVACGIYAPALSLLPAIVAARFLLFRRINRSLLLMGVVAVITPIVYLIAGDGVSGVAQDSVFKLLDIWIVVKAWLGLNGVALFVPDSMVGRVFTLGLGAVILLVQAGTTVYVLRLPAEQRHRYMIPFTLTIYSVFVFCEIIIERIHYPGVAFMPRYSIHMLGGPVSVLFWVLMLGSFRGKQILNWSILIVFVLGASFANFHEYQMLPYYRNTMAGVRDELMSLKAQPDSIQQSTMFVSRRMLPKVYPGREFLAKHHLAMYQIDEQSEISSEVTDTVKIIDFGPSTVKANVSFNVGPGGESGLWVRLDQDAVGKVYIVINSMRLHAVHRGDLVTVAVPAVLYSRPGTYPLYVLELNGGRQSKSNTINFVVHQ